ncbi:hypothetical protein AHAS_Ahas12G0141200 [Arachis hypogaea]
MVELDIVSREEFIFIERGLTKLWKCLSREKIQEAAEEIGEIVQDSMKEVVPSTNSDEVVSTGYKASMLIHYKKGLWSRNS